MQWAATAMVVVLAVLIAWARAHDYGLLDGLNASISHIVDFEVFYAGVDGKPRSTELYPALRALEDDFDAVRRDVAALVHDISWRVPTMQSTYNHMFMNATARTGRRWYHRITTHMWRLLYGKHLDIFNKIATDKWRTLNLVLYGHIVLENMHLCPRLVAHLAELDCVQTALLSFMQPGAHVPPHSDPATGVLRYHLAFVVPRERHKCYMRVDGNTYVWEEGKSVIFDTAYEHEVHNETDECRVVLFVDLHRPLAGAARWLQQLANTANRYSPGTRAVIENSGIA